MIRRLLFLMIFSAAVLAFAYMGGGDLLRDLARHTDKLGMELRRKEMHIRRTVKQVKGAIKEVKDSVHQIEKVVDGAENSAKKQH